MNAVGTRGGQLAMRLIGRLSVIRRRTARWWYAAAWLFLLAILLIRWDKVGY